MRVENDVGRVTVRSCNAAEAFHRADGPGDIDSIAPQEVSHSPVENHNDTVPSITVTVFPPTHTSSKCLSTEISPRRPSARP